MYHLPYVYSIHSTFSLYFFTPHSLYFFTLLVDSTYSLYIHSTFQLHFLIFFPSTFTLHSLYFFTLFFHSTFSLYSPSTFSLYFFTLIFTLLFHSTFTLLVHSPYVVRITFSVTYPPAALFSLLPHSFNSLFHISFPLPVTSNCFVGTYLLQSYAYHFLFPDALLLFSLLNEKMLVGSLVQIS